MGPTRPRRRWLTKYSVLGAALITAGATLGAAYITNDRGDEDEPSRCGFPAVEIKGPDQAGSTFETTTTLHCAPPSDTKYYLISQMVTEGVEGKKRTIYCPRDPFVPTSEKKSYTVVREIQSAPVGSVRQLYYLRLNSEQEQQILSNQVDTCVGELPEGVDKVSNTIEVEKGWR